MNLCPKLRFKEFIEEWATISVGKLVDDGIIDKPTDGNHGNIHPKASDYVETGIPFVMSNNISNGELDLSNVKFITKEQADSLQKGFSFEGDILLTHKGTIGETAILKKTFHPYIMLTPQVTYYRIKDRKKLNPDFLLQSFRTPRFQALIKKLSASGTRPYIGILEQRELLISLPANDKEQQKISDFLSSIDTRISKLTEKHRLLKEYKKGVMQQIFSQKIRFKQDNGEAFPDWEWLPLSGIAKKNSIKNKDLAVKSVLTNSARYGVIPQSDYFDKDIAKEDNTENYYVVDVNDFVYNPRISELAPVGPLSRNNATKGVMSPLYSVFTFNKNINLDFMEIFFKGKTWHRYMKGIANYGARHDRMNISSSDLMALPCPKPCNEEQQKIADFLKSIDKKIDGVNQQIEQTKLFKKGLLQQMFV